MKDKKLVIRVTEETKNQFDQLAKELGISSSALGAFVIGGFIRSANKSEEVIDAANETIKGILGAGGQGENPR